MKWPAPRAEGSAAWRECCDHGLKERATKGYDASMLVNRECVATQTKSSAEEILSDLAARIKTLYWLQVCVAMALVILGLSMLSLLGFGLYTVWSTIQLIISTNVTDASLLIGKAGSGVALTTVITFGANVCVAVIDRCINYFDKLSSNRRSLKKSQYFLVWSTNDDRQFKFEDLERLLSEMDPSSTVYKAQSDMSRLKSHG